MRYFLREHNAKRAGKHFDLHLENASGNFDSWAIRYWPVHVNEKRLAIKTTEHTPYWAGFSGVIEEGYGAGETHVIASGEVVWLSPHTIELEKLGTFSFIIMNEKQSLIQKRS